MQCIAVLLVFGKAVQKLDWQTSSPRVEESAVKLPHTEATQARSNKHTHTKQLHRTGPWTDIKLTRPPDMAAQTKRPLLVTGWTAATAGKEFQLKTGSSYKEGGGVAAIP